MMSTDPMMTLEAYRGLSLEALKAMPRSEHSRFMAMAMTEAARATNRDEYLDIGAAAIAAHVRAQGASFLDAQPQAPYGHLGACLVDATLQPGVNYNHVVRKRVDTLVEKYPDAARLSGFKALLDSIGASALLDWKGGDKLDTLRAVVDLLSAGGVESEHDFAQWLSDPAHVESMRAIRGVGPKTLSYFRILLGDDAVAVDRHVRDFVSQAGIDTSSCADVATMVERAAEMLGIPARHLDHAIWRAGSSAPSD